jgi:hypothetical protein
VTKDYTAIHLLLILAGLAARQWISGRLLHAKVSSLASLGLGYIASIQTCLIIMARITQDCTVRQGRLAGKSIGIDVIESKATSPQERSAILTVSLAPLKGSEPDLGAELPASHAALTRLR